MDPRKKLTLPAALVVATFLLGASCKDNPSEEEYCEDIADMAVCDAEAGCGWSEEFGECINTCTLIMTQSECVAADRCTWEQSTETDTGDPGGCHEPFT